MTKKIGIADLTDAKAIKKARAEVGKRIKETLKETKKSKSKKSTTDLKPNSTLLAVKLEVDNLNKKNQQLISEKEDLKKALDIHKDIEDELNGKIKLLENENNNLKVDVNDLHKWIDTLNKKHSPSVIAIHIAFGILIGCFLTACM